MAINNDQLIMNNKLSAVSSPELAEASNLGSFSLQDFSTFRLLMLLSHANKHNNKSSQLRRFSVVDFTQGDTRFAHLPWARKKIAFQAKSQDKSLHCPNDIQKFVGHP
ncbi:hypothetical protein [Marinifilum caeruleilacunae]|uniref:Uncharacterized protein n=1 Tax=Marinifilum caeruleilacunae TaxID=2499076 RepID=A0ABX1WTF4_9BACT|nr:hypothetical protein [Marinifilum caeruleilacunae]NOU59198.1 hypothetical protein [Marinifilum caeruleilacunae]